MGLGTCYNAVTIRIMMVLLLMMGGYAHIVDVCSAFLLGLFDNNGELYASVPKGWEKFYPSNVVLLLMRTVYGLKQAANCFYRLLVSIMSILQFEKSKADPCLYHKWDKTHGLMVWLSWCNDLLLFGRNKDSVVTEVKELKKHFAVDDVGALEDYLGCKIDFDWSKLSSSISHDMPMPQKPQELSSKHPRLDITLHFKWGNAYLCNTSSVRLFLFT